IIWPEPGEGPPHEFIDYVPTTWPGARLPHVWLDDGTALHDRIGDGFTLLRLGATRADTAGLAQAMRATGAPLDVLDIADETPRAVYGYDLLLLRPDLHVAWRGDAPPDKPKRLASGVAGKADSENGMGHRVGPDLPLPIRQSPFSRRTSSQFAIRPINGVTADACAQRHHHRRAFLDARVERRWASSGGRARTSERHGRAAYPRNG